MLERWRQWIAAFDASCEDDEWERLAGFLDEEVRYQVSGLPFACTLEGREAVIAGFARSVRGFDRHFDERQWHGIGARFFAPGTITARATGVYRKAGLPLLCFAAHARWDFRDEKIVSMADIYDPEELDLQAALGWLADHGEAMDPAYC